MAILVSEHPDSSLVGSCSLPFVWYRRHIVILWQSNYVLMIFQLLVYSELLETSSIHFLYSKLLTCCFLECSYWRVASEIFPSLTHRPHLAEPLPHQSFDHVLWFALGASTLCAPVLRPSWHLPWSQLKYSLRSCLWQTFTFAWPSASSNGFRLSCSPHRQFKACYWRLDLKRTFDYFQFWIFVLEADSCQWSTTLEWINL